MNKFLAKVIVFCSFFLVIVVCQPAFSEESEAGYERIIRKFFEIYKSGDIDKALDYVFSTSEYIDRTSKVQVKNQLKTAKDLIGTYYGYEFVDSRKVGDSLVSVTYLIKYQRQPLRFRFIFYKPLDEWIILSFRFDEQYDVELMGATKISDD
jgi:hypothetical protein